MKKISIISVLCFASAVLFISCHLKTESERRYEQFQKDSIEIVADRMAREYVDSLINAKQQEYYAGTDEIYKDSIKIEKAWLSSKNSQGGFEVHVGIRNLAHKTIKYATINGNFYNAVDDIIETKYDNAFHGKETGPIAYNKTNEDYYNKYWGLYYSWQVKYLKITSVFVEYTDGTEAKIPCEYTTKKIK